MWALSNAVAGAVFTDNKYSYEAFGSEGWESLGEDYEPNGWPFDWPANSEARAFTATAESGVTSEDYDSYEHDWGNNPFSDPGFYWAPPDVWILKPSFPVSISESVADGIGMAIYNVSTTEFRGANIQIAAGTYANATDLSAALQSAFNALGLSGAYKINFGAIDASTMYINPDTVGGLRYAMVGLPPGFIENSNADGRENLGMPASGLGLTLQDSNVLGYQISQLDTIRFGSATGDPWLAGAPIGSSPLPEP